MEIRARLDANLYRVKIMVLPNVFIWFSVKMLATNIFPFIRFKKFLVTCYIVLVTNIECYFKHQPIGSQILLAFPDFGLAKIDLQASSQSGK